MKVSQHECYLASLRYLSQWFCTWYCRV